MNILYISPSYFPLVGGTEQALCEIASRIAASHKTVLVTLQWEDMKPFERVNGMEVYRAKAPVIRGLTLFLRYLAVFILAYKLHRRFRFDCVHLFHVYECGGAALVLKKLVSIPFILTLAGWDTYSPVKRVHKRYMPVMRMIMNTADVVTSPSYHLAKAAQEQGCRQKIEIIPHGSSMHTKTALCNHEISDSLNIQNRRVVLSVQRLDTVKGLKYLLEAAREICKEHSDILFMIIGSGADEEVLKTQAKELGLLEQVSFIGHVAHDTLPSYYSIADLFVLPSLYEAFGLVYIEAMCFGIPVVTTINGGSTDIINEKTGILVPPGDPVRLSDAIITALKKKWDREAIKKEAEKYAWDGIVLKYESLYKQCITPKRETVG